MLNNKDYEIMYEKTYKDCPEELWKEFTNKISEESKKYQEFLGKDFIDNTEIKINNTPLFSIENDMDIFTDILSAISLSKISSYRKIPVSKYKKITEFYNIPVPPKEISQKLRTLPGAMANSKEKYKNLAHINVKKLTKEYLNGESMSELAKKYGTHLENIKNLITVERRMTPNELNEKTLNMLNTKDPEWYIELFDKNKNWSLEDLKNYVIENIFKNEEYSNKAMIPYFQSLGINTTEERQNASRKIKSETDKNISYMTKKTSIKLIEESHYKSIDNLTKQYCDDRIGTYRQIANNLNKELDTDHFTPRQIEKLVSKNSFYFKRRSRNESIFIEEVKKALKLKETEIVRDKIINNSSLSTIDIFIPSMNLGFEFNGDYWHSDEVVSYNYGITAKEFHQNKIDKCKNVGIRLLYVWEDDFIKNADKILQLIKNKDFDDEMLNKLESTGKRTNYIAPSNRARKIISELKINYIKDGKFFDCGNVLVKDYSKVLDNYSFVEEAQKIGKEVLIIYPWYDSVKVRHFLEYKIHNLNERIFARKCKIEITDSINNTDKKFMEDNHILGYQNFRNIIKVVKLINNNEIVGMGIFTRINDNTVELKRLAFKYGVSVVGGASKIISAFEKDNSIYTEMVTFSDNDLSGGTVYEKIGFTLLKNFKKNVVYFNPRTKQKFSKRSLYMVGADRLLKTHPGYKTVGIGEDLPSNEDIVLSYGFQKITDSGYKKWIKDLNIRPIL